MLNIAYIQIILLTQIGVSLSIRKGVETEKIYIGIHQLDRSFSPFFLLFNTIMNDVGQHIASFDYTTHASYVNGKNMGQEKSTHKHFKAINSINK